jgi:hypothetical protein
MSMVLRVRRLEGRRRTTATKAILPVLLAHTKTLEGDYRIVVRTPSEQVQVQVPSCSHIIRHDPTI